MHDRANVDIHMVCDPIETVPQHLLPNGYRFRAYCTGDEAKWTQLQRAAEPYLTIHDALFREQFGHDEQTLARRMVFVETDQNEPAGVIAACRQDNWRGRGEWGQIHWVAVHPNHQRRGISKAMMTWAMTRLQRWHGRAMLGTSTARVWAVKVYRDFGFSLDATEQNDPTIATAWADLQKQLR